MGIWLWVTVFTAGAAGQFFDAVAGMGFGVISSTVMITAGLSPAIVVGTISLAKIASGLVSGLSHWRFGNVRLRWVLPLVVPAIAGGAIAGMLIVHISEEVSRLWVPVILVVMGFLILRRSLQATPYRPVVAGAAQEPAIAIARTPWYGLTQVLAKVPERFWLGSIGFLGGVLNGLSGAFGPFVTSSVLLVKGGHPRYVVGTVNFVEFFAASAVAVTIFSQLAWREFPGGVIVALVGGSTVTAVIGAYLVRHIPARALALSIGLLLVIFNSWNIWRAVA
ncbi:MAG: sulfite exporter TauE/SafE family protein [Chloroflexi bacterium]|nr:sulfite exporter TauE/SafE family protein [Chloroflexota bacterium]